MANPSYGTGDANSIQNWEKRIYSSVVYRSQLSALIGTDEDSIIQMKKQPSKEGGDNIRYNILTKLKQRGIGEGQTATGNGETQSVYQDSLKINELLGVVTNAVSGRNIINQRIPWDLREQAKKGLSTWKAERMGQWFFNQVCGYTPETDEFYYGFNAPTAPTRQVFADVNDDFTANATDQALAANDDFSLAMIDYAVELAVTADLPMRPLNVKAGKNGSDLDEPKYVLYLYPSQVTQLRKKSSEWKSIELAALQGGNISKNKIYTGALGEYNGVILRRAVEVTQGVHSTTGASIPNVRRAVMLGAQACGLAFGKNNNANSYKWNEEPTDHNRFVETSCMSISGMKKMTYNLDGTQTDAGVMVLSSYSPKAT